MDWNLLAVVLTLAGTTIGTVGSLVWWLSRQFALLKSLVYETKELIVGKLEYHERHDDSRFLQLNNDLNSRVLQLNNDIWTIKLRNAGIDGNKGKPS